MTFSRAETRKGTITDWHELNPILAKGDIGIVTGTDQFKIGDGVTKWRALSYFTEGDFPKLTVEPFVVAGGVQSGGTDIIELREEVSVYSQLQGIPTLVGAGQIVCGAGFRRATVDTEIPWLEIFVTNMTGSQSFVAYSDGTKIIPAGFETDTPFLPADYGTPDTVGSDLTMDVNGHVRSTAGGVFCYQVQSDLRLA